MPRHLPSPILQDPSSGTSEGLSPSGSEEPKAPPPLTATELLERIRFGPFYAQRWALRARIALFATAAAFTGLLASGFALKASGLSATLWNALAAVPWATLLRNLIIPSFLLGIATLGLSIYRLLWKEKNSPAYERPWNKLILGIAFLLFGVGAILQVTQTLNFSLMGTPIAGAVLCGTLMLVFITLMALQAHTEGVQLHVDQDHPFIALALKVGAQQTLTNSEQDCYDRSPLLFSLVFGDNSLANRLMASDLTEKPPSHHQIYGLGSACLPTRASLKNKGSRYT